jgi:DegV family protein with EDD domain
MTTMKKIRIVTDSVCDIPNDLLAKWDIPVIPCYVNYGGKSYSDNGIELDRSTYYDTYTNLKEFPTTAAPSPTLAESILTKAFEGYDHLIGIHVPSSFSSTLNNIRLGAQNLPSDRVTLIDSHTFSMGIGTQVLVACEVAQQTGDVQAVINAVTQAQKYTKVYAVFYSLDALKRSGRVNPFISSVGTLLQIKPIVSAHGNKIEPIARIRTFSKALDYLYELVTAETPLERLTILHIQNEQGAKDFLARLGSLAPSDTRIVEVGPTLGTHIGVGSVGAVTLSKQWKA